MNKRRLAFCLIATVIAALACLAPALIEGMRLAAIQKAVRLTDSISMRVHDVCIYPADSTHELLRIYVTYEGADPNRDYHMRAEIGRTPNDMTFTEVWHWQVPLPGSSMDKFWEFQNYPRDGRPFFIRLYLRPKAGGEEIVRVFELPDKPRYTPNGEWPKKNFTKHEERDRAEQNGSRNRLVWHLSCHRRLPVPAGVDSLAPARVALRVRPRRISPAATVAAGAALRVAFGKLCRSAPIPFAVA